MKRPYEPSDLRKTNDRAATKRRRKAQYQARTQPIRDRVRRLELLTMLVSGGTFR